jgi:hypothetical protein
MLPNIETPIYELKIPSTNVSVKFRPFLVKEEKILLTAMEGDEETLDQRIQETTIRIVDVCTFGKLDVTKLTQFDIEYLFLNIRSKSRGEEIEPSYACLNIVDDETCGEMNSVHINLDEVKVIFPKEDNSKVMLTEDVGIQFQYLSAKIHNLHEGEKDQITKTFKIIVDSIDYIFDKNEVYKASETPKQELLEFIENLTEKNFVKVQKFFQDQPVLKHTAPYKCKKCGYTEDIVFEGINSFFEFA